MVLGGTVDRGGDGVGLALAVVVGGGAVTGGAVTGGAAVAGGAVVVVVAVWPGTLINRWVVYNAFPTQTTPTPICVKSGSMMLE